VFSFTFLILSLDYINITKFINIVKTNKPWSNEEPVGGEGHGERQWHGRHSQQKTAVEHILRPELSPAAAHPKIFGRDNITHLKK